MNRYHQLVPRGDGLGDQVVTVTTSAKTLQTLLTDAAGAVTAIPANTKFVAIQPRGGDIRFTGGPQAPTTGVTGTGLDLFDGDTIYASPVAAAKMRFIAAASTTVALAFYE